MLISYAGFRQLGKSLCRWGRPSQVESRKLWIPRPAGTQATLILQLSTFNLQPANLQPLSRYWIFWICLYFLDLGRVPCGVCSHQQQVLISVELSASRTWTEVSP